MAAVNDKVQVLTEFWNSFGLRAWDETSVPDNAIELSGGKYLTFSVATGSLSEYSVGLTASLWYYTTSWAEITQKVDEISAAVGYGGKVLPYSGGYLWIKRDEPFAQRMPDENRMVRRIALSISADFLSEN